ncbi:hypothetical protein SPRG_09787 [Saprolegnia parasitica CBS 223.65]|uniref:Uncharacterized protein n=1 Tax=Saprolegnia parasitica (strain CBS 223.65) TaxID=695850 RepID=A0A067C1J3_SAPPC|nr:hypothetical protein SPRG_09787 [Saprolegnia parasitica CBS 223.65]KDO24398.1 hypothetical protein SPRG_09787 [Saprolegnia parasitica CBS 223.65]|eukprot:XP_012204829.1 hypothetical protein SPRG_09787 [Saprolegnia parasitica CBS 223.65]
MDAAPVVVAVVVGAILLLLLWPRRHLFDLKDRVVVITGAASGIGRGLAIAMAQKGAIVACLDMDAGSLATFAREHPRLSHTFVCDVSDHARVVTCLTEVVAALGRDVDVLINNAGIVHGKPLLDLTHDQVQNIFGVNALAHFWTSQAVLPAMLARNNGMIVTMASIMGLNGSARLTDYCSSKFACVGFHEALRMELQHLGKTGVHTLLVCPMAVDSGMFRGIFASDHWWPRFVHAYLIPMITVDDVVATVIESIECKDYELLTCARSWHRWVLPLVTRGVRLLPVALMDVALGLGGGRDGMNNFQGRHGAAAT